MRAEQTDEDTPLLAVAVAFALGLSWVTVARADKLRGAYGRLTGRASGVSSRQAAPSFFFLR